MHLLNLHLLYLFVFAEVCLLLVMPGPPPPPPMMGRGLPTNRGRGGAAPAPSAGGADKNALLAAIRTGAALKKSVTNDRSTPLISGMMLPLFLMERVEC